jgi:hypothetical protein
MNLRRRLLTAALFCLSLGVFSQAHAANCDVDTDGDVDRLDLSLIISARNTPADGTTDPRDPDGDGTITMLDARTCVRQCDLPDCAIIEPSPPTPPDDASQPDTPVVTPIKKEVKDVSKPGVATSGQSSTDIQAGTIAGGTEWKVARGDTLYAIGRAIYPGNASKQASLRRDIMELNPSVFANGANNMAVGTVLKLPDYVESKSAPPKVDEPAQVPVPVADTVTPGPVSKPVASTPVVETAAESPVNKEPPMVKEESASYPFGAEGNFLVSLGYSYGGDKLVDVDGWLNITAGSGGHLRLGYEQMPHHGSGYRLALGLQYNVVKDASYRDAYLQLAYQYRTNPMVYGIGVVAHAGAKLENHDTTTDYDPAIGAVVYLENVGSSKLAGWGLSYTFLDIDEEDSGTSVDASRAELYYSWRF